MMASIDVRNLRELLIAEICKAVGVMPQDWKTRILGPLLWLPAHRFAQLGIKFDQYVNQSGFRQAADWLLPHFVKDVKINNVEMIPRQGPVLIASNHPGTIDSLALAASVPRSDLKIVASGYEFLRGLPATANHLIFTTENTHERMTVIRTAIRYLKEGGSILIFPSGKLDPDPEIMSGASEALNSWSPSLEVILRRVPQAKVVLSIISGVISPAWMHNPLCNLLTRLRNPQRIVEIMQMIQQTLFRHKFELMPKITFSSPLSTPELLNFNSTCNQLLQSILENAKQVLDTHTLKFRNIVD